MEGTYKYSNCLEIRLNFTYDLREEEEWTYKLERLHRSKIDLPEDITLLIRLINIKT